MDDSPNQVQEFCAWSNHPHAPPLGITDKVNSGLDDVDEISEAVETFVNRNQSEIDIERSPVCDKRTMIINIRKTLEGFPERMTWKERPSYWSTNVCFGDPNNELKKNEYVTEMLLFLVDEWRRRHQLEPLDNSLPVRPGIRRASLSANDWQPIQEYNRLRDHLKALTLPPELLHMLLRIVEIWVADAGTYHEEAHDLEAIVDKMKLGRCSEQSLLHSFKEFIAAENARMAIHSVQETVTIHEDSLPEPVSLREDPELEVSSSLMEMSVCLVERQKWLNESSCGGNESLEEEHQLHFEDDCENATRDLSLKQDCELLSNIVDGKDGEMPHWDLQPFLSYWKNIKGINLKDINDSTVLKYLKKMVENHLTFYIHDFHQLESNDFLAWPNEKNKLLLPYKHTSDGHFSLLFADRVERIISILDSMQIDTEKLKQSFVKHLPFTNLVGWRSVEIECPRLKRDSGLSDTCVSAYFTLMFAEAIVNGMMPIEFRQEFIPDFKVWLDYTLCSDRPVAGLLNVLFRLRGNCGVCSRVDPFPNFLKLLRNHAVT